MSTAGGLAVVVALGIAAYYLRLHYEHRLEVRRRRLERRRAREFAETFERRR